MKYVPLKTRELSFGNRSLFYKHTKFTTFIDLQKPIHFVFVLVAIIIIHREYTVSAYHALNHQTIDKTFYIHVCLHILL